jgi:aminoglycoside 3-N-acetyltransferase
MKPLIRTRSGDCVSSDSLRRALEQVGAADARALFLHTGLSFGLPNPEIPRSALLDELLAAIESLAVPTIFFPTFTFSFCNGQDFELAHSRSRMGALNEHVRRLPGTVRSRDPLLSVVCRGRDTVVLNGIGSDAIGEDSFFDRLHKTGGAKFVFFGADPAACFTYVHYVEAVRGVPYRYRRPFSGRIVDDHGVAEETWWLYVRYNGVVPSERGEFSRELARRGELLSTPCGDGHVCAVSEAAAFHCASEMLERDVDFFLAEPYPRATLDDTFTPRDMVAL